MRRRKFIKQSLFGSVGLGVLSGLYAWQVEPFWVELVERKMRFKNLPKGLEGKTLMQISDIHIGNRFNYNYIIKSFQKAQKLQPDIVVYTGDYVSYEDEKQFDQLEEVLAHSVKGSLATAAVLGNHDYGDNWSDKVVGDRISAIIRHADINLLQNEKLDIQGLNLFGIDDCWGLNYDPIKALAEVDNSKANIVLVHNPDVCDQDIWNGYQGWILSGHTHGGQCKPPFLPAPILPVNNKRYSAGEIDLEDGRTLYINRALGHLWQVRFNVRPEITLFTLDTL